MLYLFGSLVFIQVSYFQAQGMSCMTSTVDGVKTIYFWTMGQILALYMGLAVVICYFFRKFCQEEGDSGETQMMMDPAAVDLERVGANRKSVGDDH